MKFYGRMLISPIHKPPFEVLAEWEYKDGIWYGNGESYPAEICEIKFVAGFDVSNQVESTPKNNIQELREQDVRVKALIDAYAELRRYMTVEEIKAILGGDTNGLPMHQIK